MLSTKKQEEDKNDVLDVSEFFMKEENKEDLPAKKNGKRPSKPSDQKS